MIDKVIHVDFSKNKKRTTHDSIFNSLKNILRKAFSSSDKPSGPDDNKKKVIRYKKGIS